MPSVQPSVQIWNIVASYVYYYYSYNYYLLLLVLLPCLLLYISSTFFRILANPDYEHLWISSAGMPTSMVLRLSFNLCGIDPMLPVPLGQPLSSHHTFFPLSWKILYFSMFRSSVSLTLVSSGINAKSIIWHLLFSSQWSSNPAN